MKRYTILAALAAGLIVLSLATACGGEQAAEPTPEPSPTAAAAPAATPTSVPPTAAPADPPAAEAGAATSTPAADPAQEEGDPSTVLFRLAPEESQAGYSINEVFINDNNKLNTAVGVTTVMTGEFTLNYDDPAASVFSPITVDISKLKSDRSQRDRAIRTRWLESLRFPLATFTPQEVRGFPADPQEGVPMQFQLAGDMTVRETTQPVVWDVTATLEGDRLTGTATLATMLATFNIPVPSILGILKVTDGITLTLDFTFVRQP